MKLLRLVPAFVTISALSACGGPLTYTEYTVVDEGEVCLQEQYAHVNGDMDDVRLPSDTPLVISLHIGCGAVTGAIYEASCEVSVDGDVITVTSTFYHRTEPGALPAPPLACGYFDFECASVGPLEAGRYELVHGEASNTIEVGQLTTPCARSPEIKPEPVEVEWVDPSLIPPSDPI